MSATSINVQPVKDGCEMHNFRQKELDYVRPELSHLNESWSADSISARLGRIKANYHRSTGQKMQKKATPIREGVVVIHQETTMQELKEFAKRCEERFGIKAFQIHTHKDEGYMNAKEWTPNLHAHIVFDWTQNTGKSCKLNRQNMCDMQTILSECLGMERGISSDKQHLSAVQYKVQQEEERISKLEAERRAKELKIAEEEQRNKRAEIQRVQSEKEVVEVQTRKNILVKEVTALKKEKQIIKTGIRVKQAIIKTAERFKDFLGISVNDKEKIRLIAERNALISQNNQLSNQNKQLKNNILVVQQRNDALDIENSELSKLNQNYTKLKTELKNFIILVPDNKRFINSIQEKFPRMYAVFEHGLQSLQRQHPEQQEKRGRRM
jgi:hypothetical protein